MCAAIKVASGSSGTAASYIRHLLPILVRKAGVERRVPAHGAPAGSRSTW
jgi:hypothetical protein